MPESVYKVIELVGTSTESWEKAAAAAVTRAANVDLEDNTVLGTADIVYSSCAIERAILNSALTQARPLDARSWVDLSSVSY